MIIDFRLRPPAKSFLRASMYADMEKTGRMNRGFGMTLAPSVKEKSMKLLLKEMDEAGISKAVIPARAPAPGLGGISNDEVAELVQEYPDRFIGFGAIDPSNRREALNEIDRVIKVLGFKGVTVEPGMLTKPVYPNDQSLYPIYARCEELGIPVILTAGGNAGPDLSYTLPIYFDKVAVDFPSLPIISAHGSWPWVTEILHVAFRRTNVFVSPDMYLFNVPGCNEYIQAANYYLEDRLLFASSYPFVHLKQAVDYVKNLSLKEGVMEKFLYKNAQQLLGAD